MILEQGLALGELLGMKTSYERKQGESGGEQQQPIAGAAGSAVVPSSLEFSDCEGVTACKKGDIPAKDRKYSSSLIGS